MITLATLSQATAQEVFDHVATHLLTQNKKSIVLDDVSEDTNEAKCKYRGDYGLKCAAGCLMSDEEYKSDWEGFSWDYLANYEIVPNAHENLIRDLQIIHDGIEVRLWKGNLKLLATKYNLSPSILDKFQ